MKNEIINEDTLDSLIEDIWWTAEVNGWTAELKRKLTYYTMLSELEERIREINTL